jgi:signal recognition particle receptor subunit beta
MNGLESSSRAKSTVLHGTRWVRGALVGRHRTRHLRLVVDERVARSFREARARILVTGGPRVGKTTFVGTASESVALPAEVLAPLLGNMAPAEALDIGRITVTQDPKVELWLVGSPGERHCWPMWDVLRRDPATLIGAVVLVDVRRLLDCRAALEYLGRHRVPYILAVNEFDGAQWVAAEQIHAALGVDGTVPVVYGDARRRADARGALTRLVEHSLGMPGPRPWDG